MGEKNEDELEVVTVTGRTISWKCPSCNAYWEEEDGSEGSVVTCRNCDKNYDLE